MLIGTDPPITTATSEKELDKTTLRDYHNTWTTCIAEQDWILSMWCIHKLNAGVECPAILSMLHMWRRHRPAQSDKGLWCPFMVGYQVVGHMKDVSCTLPLYDITVFHCGQILIYKSHIFSLVLSFPPLSVLSQFSRTQPEKPTWHLLYLPHASHVTVTWLACGSHMQSHVAVTCKPCETVEHQMECIHINFCILISKSLLFPLSSF